MRLVSWNVNGLLTTLKDAAHRYSSPSHFFAEILHADIVCFQEAKIQEEKLERWIACVDGYDSFWAFSKIKKGFNGVVTYVKEDLAPLDARADWFGDEDTAEEFLKEGRLLYTDHGNFILLNVYVPNAGVSEEGRPRLNFKLRFLETLERLCDTIVRSGKHIVVVGDFNIAHKEKDVHKCRSLEELYSIEERTWIDRFLTKYVDLFRHFHPNLQDVYSVWNMKTSARIHNEGVRIDYAVCDPEFLMQVVDVEIRKMIPVQWSDHAAVFVTLLDQPPLPSHCPPLISSRNMRQFQVDNRQKKLTALLATKPLKDISTHEACGLQTIKGRGKASTPVSEDNINRGKLTNSDVCFALTNSDEYCLDGQELTIKGSEKSIDLTGAAELDAANAIGFESKQDSVSGPSDLVVPASGCALILNQSNFVSDSNVGMKHKIPPPLQKSNISKTFASVKAQKTRKEVSRSLVPEPHTKGIKQKSLSSFFRPNQLDKTGSS